MNEAWRAVAERLAGSLHKPRVHLSDLLLTICEATYPNLDRPRIEAEIEGFARDVRTRLDVVHREESRHVEEFGHIGDASGRDRARRAGSALVGVGLPGHFLVRHPKAQPPLFCDPFDAGRVLEIEELPAGLDRVHSGALRFQPETPAAATPREFAARVLRNLKASYLRRNQFDAALGATEGIVRIVPEDANEWWDRGRIRLQLQDPLGALEDFTQCLNVAPAGPLRREVEAAIRCIRIVLLQRN